MYKKNKRYTDFHQFLRLVLTQNSIKQNRHQTTEIVW